LSNARRYPDLVPASRFTRGPALVLAPHPDDEVAACGGMVLHHVDAGNPVTVAFLTDGARGSWKSEHDRDYVALREQEARTACAFQGTEEPRFLRFPDGGLSAKDPDLVAAIQDLVEEIQPFVVYSPSFFEIHNDHRQTALALLEALGHGKHGHGKHGHGKHDPWLLLGEIGAPAWANLLVDITAVFDRKIHALTCYESQLCANDYRPSLRGLDQYRTVNIDMRDVQFAEAYLAGRWKDLVPMVGVVDRMVNLAQCAADALSE
jgi:LmbE family N-acetylglucosaminyl deacetylase